MDVKGLTETMMQKMRGILESGGEAIPIIFTIAPNGEIDIIGIGDMSDEQAKDRVASILQNLVTQPTVACVVFLADSYVGSMSKEEYDEKPELLSVRDLPDHTEAIVATVSGRGIETQMAQWKYARDRGGHPKFAQIEWMTKAEIGGRFAPETESRKVS